MKIEINQDVCIGCGICENFCSECFVMNASEGKAEVVKAEGCDSCNAKDVEGRCPVGAISVSE